MDNTELNNLTAHARRMAHMARSGSIPRVPQLRATTRARALTTSIATGVAVLTVLVSALAVRAGDDPLSYSGSRFPGWLIVLGLTLVGRTARAARAGLRTRRSVQQRSTATTVLSDTFGYIQMRPG